ncbi:uncharacterized protein LTR77_003511 [Saxophila tyrrhenica]|uniref:UDENN domain-containing protein n=1 Tax=Saxophila tyrrhenica TaxID=1690608 RepID=A0AAV9PEK7_9PEZI|nr:hypothetical protein LTR77_003511 [Saxophila tyrrhenica]
MSASPPTPLGLALDHMKGATTTQHTSTNSHPLHNPLLRRVMTLPGHSYRTPPPMANYARPYPSDRTEKHVEYILVASFDIDRGSVMEHQYPGPVGGDEHMLAELMLPDGAHVRAQDWTIFFLHKDGAVEEDEEQGGRKKKKRRRAEANGQAGGGAEDDSDAEGSSSSGDESDNEPDDIDGPPLVYVLNLVNMKQDKTVKRGAVVKAMAICTRHSFLHIYKPLLLLALGEYFANPVVETLASLYEAVNSMDLSLVPKLSIYEKSILQSSEAKDLFLSKFEALIAQRMASKEKDGTHPSQSPTSQLHTRNRYGLPRDTHEFESIVKYANVPVPVKVPVALSPETVGDFSMVKLITTFATPHATAPTPFSPTHPHLTTSGPLTHPIIVLLNALLTQKRIIFLGHNLPSSEVAEAVLGACSLASGGLLRGFTRHAFPYTDLTKIDDLLKVPGFIAGVTNPAFAHKTEWWDVLCDISTGKMRISNRIEQAPLTEGVAFFHSNGAGAHHTSDKLGNPGGTGGISSIVAVGASMSAGLGGNATPASNMSGDITGDATFMNNVIAAINERHGENAIRAKFRRWILKFIRIAAAFEEVVYGATSLYIHPSITTNSPSLSIGSPRLDSPSKTSTAGGFELPPEVTGHGYVWPHSHAKNAELAANATRLEGWRNTRSYYYFIQDLAAYYVRQPVKELDLQHLHDKLSKLRMNPEASSNIYLAICAAVQSDAEISQLLSTILTGSSAADSSRNAGAIGTSGQPSGLFTLALGLFHPRLEVREQIAMLLDRIREHEAGCHFWSQLGRFVKIGFERVVEAREIRLNGDVGAEGHGEG